MVDGPLVSVFVMMRFVMMMFLFRSDVVILVLNRVGFVLGLDL